MFANIRESLASSIKEYSFQILDSATIQAIIEGRLEPSQYLSLIRQYLSLHDWLSKHQSEIDNFGIFPLEQDRTKLIRKDFAYWNTDLPQVELLSVTRRLIIDLDDAVARNEAARAGVAYVLEGSRNGHAIMGRALARSLDVPAERGHGVDYFIENDGNQHAQWLRIVRRFEFSSVSVEDAHEVLSAATRVMECFAEIYDAVAQSDSVFTCLPNRTASDNRQARISVDGNDMSVNLP